MLFQKKDGIFDTLIDPRKNYGTMKTRFSIRKDVQVNGKCPVYLHINGNERRINLKVYVEPKYWLIDKKRVKEATPELRDINLILDQCEGKLSNIKTEYRLNDEYLTAESLENEFLGRLSKVNFVAFLSAAIENEKVNLTIETHNRHLAVYNKIKEWKANIPFNEINIALLNKYKSHLKNVKKNKMTTISSNMAVIKKYLSIAKKNGVKLKFDLDDLKIGDTKGNRNYLNQEELKTCLNYYFGPTYNESYKLVLGYFLFSCMTGLRITNVQQLERKELLDSDFQFINLKSQKDKTVSLNIHAKRIVDTCPELFVKKFHNNHINGELKSIMRALGIKKKICFHVARHTFATLFLRAGGKIQNLKTLLGHSKIETTMIYVHLIDQEANEEIFLLDDLLNRD
jgi:site-specific recombinase XerD